MNCPMMQTILSRNLVAYASMTNQSPENSLTSRIQVTLTLTGILDCRGKPLLQKLEQITLHFVNVLQLYFVNVSRIIFDQKPVFSTLSSFPSNLLIFIFLLLLVLVAQKRLP